LVLHYSILGDGVRPRERDKGSIYGGAMMDFTWGEQSGERMPNVTDKNFILNK